MSIDRGDQLLSAVVVVAVGIVVVAVGLVMPRVVSRLRPEDLELSTESECRREVPARLLSDDRAMIECERYAAAAAQRPSLPMVLSGATVGATGLMLVVRDLREARGDSSASPTAS